MQVSRRKIFPPDKNYFCDHSLLLIYSWVQKEVEARTRKREVRKKVFVESSQTHKVPHSNYFTFTLCARKFHGGKVLTISRDLHRTHGGMEICEMSISHICSYISYTISSSSCLYLKMFTDENVQILMYFQGSSPFLVTREERYYFHLCTIPWILMFTVLTSYLPILSSAHCFFFQLCDMTSFSMQFFHICIVLIQSNSHKIIINWQCTYQLMQRDGEQIQELCFVMVSSNAHYKLSVLSAA